MTEPQDVLAEELHREFWDDQMEHGPEGCVEMEAGSADRITRALAARGYALVRAPETLLADTAGIDAARLREVLGTHLVPWFKVRGDDANEQGTMRRCLLCGRTSAIVDVPAEHVPFKHEPDCAFEALAAALRTPKPEPE